MGMNKHNIELHIEELVLHGFSTSDRYRIAEALKYELVGVISGGGVRQNLINGRAIAVLDGGSFQVGQGSKPETTGAQIARAVYGGMKK